MSLGSIVTLGYSPGGAMALIPTIGYSLGGAAAVTATTSIHGTDEEIDYFDHRRIRQKREEREILQVIRQFLKLI